MRWICTEQVLGPGGYGISNHQIMEHDCFACPSKMDILEIDEDASGPFLRLESYDFSSILKDLLKACQDEIRKNPELGDYLTQNLVTILTGRDAEWGLVGIGLDTKETRFAFASVKTATGRKRYTIDQVFVVLKSSDAYHEFFVNVPDWDGTVSEKYQITTEDGNVHIDEYRDEKIVSDAELYLEEIDGKKVEKIRIWEYRR